MSKLFCKLFGHGRLYITVDWMIPKEHRDVWNEYIDIKVKCIRCEEVIEDGGGSTLERRQIRRTQRRANEDVG